MIKSNKIHKKVIMLKPKGGRYIKNNGKTEETLESTRIFGTSSSFSLLGQRKDAVKTFEVFSKTVSTISSRR